MVPPVLFYRHKHPFSNFSYTPITTADGLRFPTTEHHFHYRKAALFEDAAAAALLLKADTPTKAKALGGAVKGYDDESWRAARERVMLEGIRLKIEQHPEIKRKLVETGDALIAEATSRDKTWAIGLNASDPAAQDPANWCAALARAALTPRAGRGRTCSTRRGWPRAPRCSRPTASACARSTATRWWWTPR